MNYTYPQSQQCNNTVSPRATQSMAPATASYTWNTRIRPVSSIEEVRAYPIDFDGSVFYFPDIANKRIYTKQINSDGTANLSMYELKEMPVEQPNSVNSSYITREEFEEAINQLKMSFAAMPSPEISVSKETIPSNVMQF